MSTVTAKTLKIQWLAVLEELLQLQSDCCDGASAPYKSRVLEGACLRTFVSISLKLWFHPR